MDENRIAPSIFLGTILVVFQRPIGADASIAGIISEYGQMKKDPPHAMDPGCSLERVTGIEPALSAWKAGVLPLNYTRINALKARWSGRQDSNLRHPAPKAGALPNCATSRLFSSCSIPNYPPWTSIFFPSSRIAWLRGAVAWKRFRYASGKTGNRNQYATASHLDGISTHRTPPSRTEGNASSWQQAQLRFVDNADSPLPHQRRGNPPSRNQSAGKAPVVHQAAPA